MRALLALVLVAGLAGCAGEPPPMPEAAEPTFSDMPHLSFAGPAPLEWQTLAEQSFVLSPASSVDVGVSVPPRAIAVYVNLTLGQGALYGIGVHAGACHWTRDVLLVATGQTVGADCGGLSEGSHAVSIQTPAGAAAGEAKVVALVCVPEPRGSACPAPMPVPE